jgi:molybdopterin-binding protein
VTSVDVEAGPGLVTSMIAKKDLDQLDGGVRWDQEQSPA